MTRNDLRRKNACPRDQIAQVVEKDPELRDVTEGIALRQDLHVEVGTPFLERTQGKLQERARAMIERRPELDRYFDIRRRRGLPNTAGGTVWTAATATCDGGNPRKSESLSWLPTD